jgi:ribonuclease P protein component
LIVNVLRHPEGGLWRSGVITSRKVGGAVQRNLARRRLREIIRQAGIQDGVWVVTVARWRILEASFEEWKQDWMRAARRARILQQEAATSGTP